MAPDATTDERHYADASGTELLAWITEDIRSGTDPTNATADHLRASPLGPAELLAAVTHMDALDGRPGDVAAQNAMESLAPDASMSDLLDTLAFETYRWLATDMANGEV